MNTPPGKSKAAFTIVTAGVVVGILDITSAIVIWLTRGVAPTHGLQGIAAGILGAKSFEGGLATASLGLAIHFFVAFVVVAIFYVASRRILFLTEYPLIAGALYGVGVYLVMYWVVLPAAFQAFRHRLPNDALAIAIHIILIGVPTALIVRRYSRSQT